MPGGYIGVNSGLVVSTSTESELASVIAHEVGHVVLRHIARGMTEQSQGRGVLLASLVGALLAALSGRGIWPMGLAFFGRPPAITNPEEVRLGKGGFVSVEPGVARVH